MEPAKSIFTSKTFWGIAVAALGVLAGPDLKDLIEPIFGGTLPMWVSNILKAAGLVWALYGRWKATQPVNVLGGN